MSFSSRLVIVCLLAVASGGCDRQKPAEPQGGAPDWARPLADKRQGVGRLDRSFAGTPAPTAAFEDPDGELTSLVQFRGKPVLVNLWATWCSPCVAEMPTLDALAGRDNGIEVLAISQDLQGREKVSAFFAERKFSRLEPYLDPEVAMMMELKVDTLPTTILYDAEGRELWRVTGKEDWTGERAAGLIREAVKG